MIWIVCALSFFVGSVVTVFLMSCMAISQQEDEKSDRILSVLVEKNAVR